jgi:hypothetical protein
MVKKTLIVFIILFTASQNILTMESKENEDYEENLDPDFLLALQLQAEEDEEYNGRYATKFCASPEKATSSSSSSSAAKLSIKHSPIASVADLNSQISQLQKELELQKELPFDKRDLQHEQNVCMELGALYEENSAQLDTIQKDNGRKK